MSSRIEDNLCEQPWMGDPVDLQGGSRTRDSPTRIDINSIMFCYVVYVQKKNWSHKQGPVTICCFMFFPSWWSWKFTFWLSCFFVPRIDLHGFDLQRFGLGLKCAFSVLNVHSCWFSYSFMFFFRFGSRFSCVQIGHCWSVISLCFNPLTKPAKT
jgi:hypothetical protein